MRFRALIFFLPVILAGCGTSGGGLNSNISFGLADGDGGPRLSGPYAGGAHAGRSYSGRSYHRALPSVAHHRTRQARQTGASRRRKNAASKVARHKKRAAGKVARLEGIAPMPKRPVSANRHKVVPAPVRQQERAASKATLPETGASRAKGSRTTLPARSSGHTSVAKKHQGDMGMAARVGRPKSAAKAPMVQKPSGREQAAIPQQTANSPQSVTKEAALVQAKSRPAAIHFDFGGTAHHFAR